MWYYWKLQEILQVILISAKFVLLEMEYGTISDIRIFWSEKFDVKIIREK